MPQRVSLSWLCALPALAVLTATAQVNTPPAAPTPNFKNAATAQTNGAQLPYQSIFDGYRRYTDAKLQPWKQTNAAVEAAGGWRAYAKEAAEPASPQPQDSSMAPPASAAPIANPHAGHGKH